MINLIKKLALLSFCLLAVTMMFGCPNSGQNTGVNTTSTSTSTGGSNSGSTIQNELQCEQIAVPSSSCSGTQCCRGDTACEKDCDYIDGGSSRCERLDIAKVSEIRDVVENIADRPSKDDLDNLTEDHLSLLCGTLKALGIDVLRERYSNLNASNAKRLLNWFAEQDYRIELFSQTNKEEGEINDGDGSRLLKLLFSRLGNGNSADDDDTVIAGLMKKVDDNGRESFMEVGNDKVRNFVHNQIIVDNNSWGICPDPDESTKNYPLPDGVISDYNREACILGVYCKISGAYGGGAGRQSADDNFRKDIANLKNLDLTSQVTEFINAEVTLASNKAQGDGGLRDTRDEGTTDEIKDRDGDNWTHRACLQLKKFWDNGSTLDLGLDGD